MDVRHSFATGKKIPMRWPAGVAAIAAFAVAGCGGTTSSIGAGASDLVPASAPAFVAVDTDPGSSQWKEVDELASRFPDKQQGVDSIKQDMRKDGVDWDKDVKPALGKEMDFAWLDFANNGRNFVILAQPSDEAAFKRLIEKSNKSETDPTNRVVYDKYRDWEVLALDRSTIDRFEHASDSSGTTLAEQSAFKHSMDRLGGDAVVRAYVNGPFLMNLARRYGGAQVQPYLDKVGTLDWIAMRSGATSRGVGLDVIVHGTPGKLFKGANGFDSFKPKLIGSVPQNALLYYTFHGSKNMFSGLQGNALFANPQYRPFRRILGDVGRLLQGENALYVRPGAGHAPDVPFAIPEVTLLASPGHGTDGAAVIDRMLKREAGVDPSFTTIGGRAVRKLGNPDLGLFYTDVGDKLVVTDEPAGIRGAANTGTPLSKSDTFKDVADASGLPSKNQGFLYVDIHSTVPVVEKLAHAHVPAEIARNLKPLRSAVEYTVAKSHEFQVTFFLRIK